ncbi:hypothetical protein CIB95_06075 [Lottiidibacillus patelloidae]|uniref:Tissue inhibitor of metalloproteinase n=1 Tax=Lottiidibacillus patelloidae TaxID=2670334 RepID=A0A263BW79_9BACI|nr:hypothetical protein [Lottiidibacillus patelloidae]OZM57920.1 hypothetical protein CIB95_06075 [Lottiidibacillus patelloidae]
MKIVKLLLILFISLSIFSPTRASACSCVEPAPVETEYKRAEAVFVGTVSNVIEKNPFNGTPHKSVLLEVETVWKGEKTTQVIITTGLGGGDCGISFKEGDKYLVYAFESYDNPKLLRTGICSRTTLWKESLEDFSELGPGEVPTDKVDLTGEMEQFSIAEVAGNTASKMEEAFADNTAIKWFSIIGFAILVTVGIIFIKKRGK